MSDITKCADGCAKQLLCKRYTAPPHPYRQSYADFKPDAKTGICAEYWANDVARAKEDATHTKNHDQQVFYQNRICEGSK